MKNIHVLPTDKPSRLFIHNAFNDLRLDSKNVLHDNNQNIYITSDEEEIKEGDWILNETHNIEKAISHYNYKSLSSDCKKIILTTDVDLITDNVQAIDDEFLGWYIKNPNCEFVEFELIDTFKKTNEVYVDEITSGNYYEIIKKYKIIIPKEEPLIEFTNTNDFTSMIYNPTDEKGRLMTYWGGLKEPKQETLEEAAERLYPIILEDDGWDKNKQYRDEWIDGAKWQQNDCVQFINKLEDDSFDGWSEEAINGYLTACITIKNKLKLK